jgi:uncharacterized membrane protein (UPF0136 family)
VRALAALTLAGVVLGAAVGALYAAAAGTSLHRAVAYGIYAAAAVVLVLAPISSLKLIYRRTSLPLVEGWIFVGSALALCAVGAAIDVA